MGLMNFVILIVDFTGRRRVINYQNIEHNWRKMRGFLGVVKKSLNFGTYVGEIKPGISLTD